MKGVVGKVETLKEGEIKLSIDVPREFKMDAMALHHREVFITDVEDSKFKVNRFAAIPRVADFLRRAATILLDMDKEQVAPNQEADGEAPNEPVVAISEHNEGPSGPEALETPEEEDLKKAIESADYIIRHEKTQFRTD